MKISTVNRELQVLRRMFTLAIEWGKVERALPKIRTIPGEAHRDRVLSASEEKAYFDAAQLLGFDALAMYESALEGIRATQRESEQPNVATFRSNLVIRFCCATRRRFWQTAKFARKNAFGYGGRAFKTTSSKLHTAKPKTRGGEFRSPVVRLRS
jgi:hypothetical protein